MLLAVLLFLAAIAGSFLPATYAHEHPNWAAQAIGQDIVDLGIVAPGLLLAAILLARGNTKVVGIWRGMLLYVAYSYTLYSFFVRFSAWSLIYFALLGVSVHGLIATATIAESVTPGRRLRLAAGWLLIAGSGLFALLWLSEIISALVAGTIPQSALDAGLIVNPVHVLDLALLLPAMGIGGVQLLRNRPPGRAWAVPLLTFMALMGSAIMGMSFVQHARGFPLVIAPLVVMAILVSASVGLVYAFRRTTSPDT
jgi:hypothetical protein